MDGHFVKPSSDHKLKGAERKNIKAAYIRAEAERAALLVKAAFLKQKHAIEEQQRLIRQQLEMHELETQIAAAKAKFNVLKSSSRYKSSHKSRALATLCPPTLPQTKSPSLPLADQTGAGECEWQLLKVCAGEKELLPTQMDVPSTTDAVDVKSLELKCECSTVDEAESSELLQCPKVTGSHSVSNELNDTIGEQLDVVTKNWDKSPVVESPPPVIPVRVGQKVLVDVTAGRRVQKGRPDMWSKNKMQRKDWSSRSSMPKLNMDIQWFVDNIHNVKNGFVKNTGNLEKCFVVIVNAQKAVSFVFVKPLKMFKRKRWKICTMK